MVRSNYVVGFFTLVFYAGILCGQDRGTNESVYKHKEITVVVPDFSAEGLILDIGGGGEGVIGQLKGKQVVAIDISKRELEDAPGAPLIKIVMDARDLQFLDNAFPTATVFFTFMYIDPADHEKIFKALYRVLEPGGRLLIWDVVFPEETDANHIQYPLHVILPHKDIHTGYGVHMVKGGQGSAHFIDVSMQTGFRVVTKMEKMGWFYIELKKSNCISQ